jgi:ribosome-associated protein
MPEIEFRTSRSSGKGGQHVNKVDTKVELRFDVMASELLSEEEKARITGKLGNRITSEGILQVVSESERTQLLNKKEAVERFYNLLEEGIKVPRKRKPTKKPKKAKEKRLKDKKIRSEVKNQRKSPGDKND